ncbi:MAG: hypothetical protein RKH07_06350 [Gammaproteobacteria bacterium]
MFVRTYLGKSALLALCSSLALSATAQESDYEVPRTSFGVPDLQGTWNIATVTMLERDAKFNGKLVITPEEALEVGQTGESYLDGLTAESDEPDVGGYNTFWMDPGERMAEINGEIRTSIIVEPEDGRLPWDPEGRRAAFASLANPLGAFAGPESRPLGERCLVGFGSSGGPPMLPVLYNNHSQIVQTPDYVVILAEMNHDARIIRMRDGKHLNRQPWMGDSMGWYEGDTLVVETTNFHPQQSFRASLRHFIYLSSDAVVTERFTRVSDDKIHYRFTVDDPKVYTQPWVGEIPMNAVEDRIYEYACHEGNYALPGILAGARKDEVEGSASQ